MNFNIIKQADGTFRAFSVEDERIVARIPERVVCSAKWVRPRSHKFHNKAFALLRLGFDFWCEHGGTHRNFEWFREDVLIALRYVEAIGRIDGTIAFKAKSMSEDKMPPEEFERLYSDIIDYLIDKVYQQSITEQELRDHVDRLLSFV